MNKLPEFRFQKSGKASYSVSDLPKGATFDKRKGIISWTSQNVLPPDAEDHTSVFDPEYVPQFIKPRE